MSNSVQSSPARFRLQPDYLRGLAESHHEKFVCAVPFPHVVIDDFLPAEILDQVLAEFPDPRGRGWDSFESPNERKLASNQESTMGDATRELLAELNSGTAIDFLEELTGIKGLVPDPQFVGGGLHQIERGGHLKVHVDFNRHTRTDLERRLNLLVYLNRDWKEEYGGALELWSRGMRSCEARILPIFNRCVIFATTETSYHGHPDPLMCPEDRTRKSLALYYYSRDRPAAGRGESHNTLWQARPGESVAPAPEVKPRLAERVVRAVRLIVPPILLNVTREVMDRRRRQSGRLER
jgi:Rps23 Pro-64 3,4-dihydroxylase Tpa1-like proline 4-hydroxylase